MTITAAYVSTPVLTIAGRVAGDAMADLLSLVVEEDTTGMARCEARFTGYGTRQSRQGYLYLSRDVLDFGTELAVKLGAGPQERTVFTGRISALQADFPADRTASVLVLAEDSLAALRLTRRTRTFENTSTAEVARTIASDHSLTADVDLPGPTRPVTTQVNQSDLALLRLLARADDGEVCLDGSTLRVQRRRDRDGGSLALTYGTDLISFSVRADLADQCTDVVVTGWSVSDKDAVAESAGADVLGAELAPGDTSGSAALSTAFADRTERVVRSGVARTDEARSLASALYLERARRFVCGTGTTLGTPALRVGAAVRLGGLGMMLSGQYRVTRTRHQFDKEHGGYTTEFDVERAGIGAAR